MGRRRLRPCPTPRKPKYRDRVKAQLAAIEVMAKKPHHETQEPYRCPCGKWHLRTAEKRRKE